MIGLGLNTALRDRPPVGICDIGTEGMTVQALWRSSDRVPADTWVLGACVRAASEHPKPHIPGSIPDTPAEPPPPVDDPDPVDTPDEQPRDD